MTASGQKTKFLTCERNWVYFTLTAAAGFWAALPVTMGVRAMFDRYRSKALTNHRVQGRIDRLRELRELMAKQKNPEEETSKAETVVAVSGVVG